MRASDVMLAIDPFSFHFEGDRLFDAAFNSRTGENLLGPFAHLRDWFARRGVRVHTADRLARREVGAALNVVMSFGLRRRGKTLAKRDDVRMSAFFAFESPVVEPALYRHLPEMQACFGRVYSFSDSDSLQPLTGRAMTLHDFRIPYPFDGVREDLWRRDDRGFLVMINNNKRPAIDWHELYTERVRAVEFFARSGEIDLYGRGWDQPSFQMGIGWMPGTLQHALRLGRAVWERARPDSTLQGARRAYRGPLPSKLAVLGEYTFCVCFENTTLNGYVTEKLLDCLVTGTIPIYLGAPDIGHHVPDACFIDMRRFEGYDDLRRFLKALGPDDIRAYREAGRDYLRSPAFSPFTPQAFVDLVARLVEKDAGISLRDAA